MRRSERDLRRLAQRHGWSVERTSNDHWRLRHPGTGKTVIASFTSGDGNFLRILDGCLRRAERPKPTYG